MNLNIPTNLIGHDSREVNFSFLSGKTVIGLAGYSKSGKDKIGGAISGQHSFKRVAFGDIMKQDMNTYFKNDVIVDLAKTGVEMNVGDVDFLNPKTTAIKEALRPYMIWFGEEMRRINGAHYWTNRALAEIGDHQKVVMTDIRRECELDIFINKNQTYTFKSLLVHVSQYGLTDTDELTVKAIRRAQELWLLGHTILIDSRIPEGDYRVMHIKKHINDLVEKFPEYFA